ncbi:MAG TPA: hypothetical protein VGD78_08365 [Chthoniobacterales bacterium]
MKRAFHGIGGHAFSAGLVYAAFAAEPALAQEDPSLRSDPHYRDELGVNAFTAPSIADVFQTLDGFKPIPWAKVEPASPPLITDDRVRYALSFGVLIGNGFLAVEREDAKAIDRLGRELLRQARGLGVAQRVTQHGQRLLEYARRGAWDLLRKELTITQRDVENAMLDLRDDEVAHLLSLGGWLRGLEIAAACVADNYSTERAQRLRKLDLLDYYLDRLQTLNPRLRRRPLVALLQSGLRDVRERFQQEVPSREDIQAVYAKAQGLVGHIEGDEPASSAAGAGVDR